MKNEVFRYNKAGIKKDRTKERIPLSCHINKMKKTVIYKSLRVSLSTALHAGLKQRPYRRDQSAEWPELP